MFVDPESVTNKNEFKIIESNAICPICHGIIVSPIQCTECQNCFCSDCIKSWINKKKKNHVLLIVKNLNLKNQEC